MHTHLHVTIIQSPTRKCMNACTYLRICILRCIYIDIYICIYEWWCAVLCTIYVSTVFMLLRFLSCIFHEEYLKCLESGYICVCPPFFTHKRALLFHGFTFVILVLLLLRLCLLFLNIENMMSYLLCLCELIKIINELSRIYTPLELQQLLFSLRAAYNIYLMPLNTRRTVEISTFIFMCAVVVEHCWKRKLIFYVIYWESVTAFLFIWTIFKSRTFYNQRKHMIRCRYTEFLSTDGFH